MIDCRSRAALSGVRFVQKYCSEFTPTTGIPFEARIAEIDLSIFAHPPSPDTKTTNESELPRVAGISMRGSFAVARKSERRKNIEHAR